MTKGQKSTIRGNECDEKNCQHREELERDLDLMMRSRKALYEGMGRILLACGTYMDCQERGGDYPLEQAMQDVMNASSECWVNFNRVMDGEPELTEAEITTWRTPDDDG